MIASIVAKIDGEDVFSRIEFLPPKGEAEGHSPEVVKVVTAHDEGV